MMTHFFVIFIVQVLLKLILNDKSSLQKVLDINQSSLLNSQVLKSTVEDEHYKT